MVAQISDAGDTLSYALTDDANGRFVIDAASGAIAVVPVTIICRRPGLGGYGRD